MDDSKKVQRSMDTLCETLNTRNSLHKARPVTRSRDTLINHSIFPPCSLRLKTTHMYFCRCVPTHLVSHGLRMLLSPNSYLRRSSMKILLSSIIATDLPRHYDGVSLKEGANHKEAGMERMTKACAKMQSMRKVLRNNSDCPIV